MAAPAIAITNPTPPKLKETNYQTPSRSVAKLDRLLYRGSLSLPDSHLVLDGLTFFARTGSPGKYSESKSNLLDNPLALSLEIMRGRPSLRFMSTVKMKDIWIDESGGVEMDIHPSAALTRVYFENMFCIEPFTADGLSTRSELGVRVSLGDTDSSETTHMVIFARMSDQPLQASGSTVDLVVARILSSPPASTSQIRLPRPDDAMPRKPPLVFAASTGIGKAKPRELKRSASSMKIVNAENASTSFKRQRTESVDMSLVPDLGSDFRTGDFADSATDDFKIPSLPTKRVDKGKGKGREESLGIEEDVFGPKKYPDTKNKKKRQEEDETQTSNNPIERENKHAIKKTAMHYLTSGFRSNGVETPAISKTHPDFKEIYQYVYRGASFALRLEVPKHPLDSDVIEKLVKMHVGMYVSSPSGS